MKILVCGSRTWTDEERIQATFESIPRHRHEKHELIQGAARGADLLAVKVARRCGLFNSIRHFYADWAKYGRVAEMIRNKVMLEEGKPDLVLAFWDGKSRGTANMLAQAQAAGVTVQIERLDAR